MPLPFIITALAVIVTTVIGKTLYDKYTSDEPTTTTPIEPRKSCIILLSLVGAGKSKTLDVVSGKGFINDNKATAGQPKEARLDLCPYDGVEYCIVDTAGYNLTQTRIIYAKNYMKTQNHYILFMYLM